MSNCTSLHFYDLVYRDLSYHHMQHIKDRLHGLILLAIYCNFLKHFNKCTNWAYILVFIPAVSDLTKDTILSTSVLVSKQNLLIFVHLQQGRLLPEAQAYSDYQFGELSSFHMLTCVVL